MQYKITNVNRRSEWPFNGKTMVDYAIALEGETGWIKLTQVQETPAPEIGQELNGRIEEKFDKHGNPYKKFKKENPNFPGNQGGGGGNQSRDIQELKSRVDFAVLMLEELTGRRDSDGNPINEAGTENLLEEDPFPGL